MSTPATHAFVSVDLLAQCRDHLIWHIDDMVALACDFDRVDGNRRPIAHSGDPELSLEIDGLIALANELDAALDGTVERPWRPVWMADVLSGALPLFQPEPDDVACTDVEGGCRHDH